MSLQCVQTDSAIIPDKFFGYVTTIYDDDYQNNV